MVESLERERQARLKEAVAGEPSSDGKDEKRERLVTQINALSGLVKCRAAHHTGQRRP